MAIGGCYIFGCIFGGNIDVERIAVALSYLGVLNAIKCCAIICVSFLRDLENLCWFGKINPDFSLVGTSKFVTYAF